MVCSWSCHQASAGHLSGAWVERKAGEAMMTPTTEQKERYDRVCRQMWGELNEVVVKYKHGALYVELCELLAKHHPDVSSDPMMSIAANLDGKLIAMQDPRVITPQAAMLIVVEDLRIGNREILDQLSVEGIPN